MLRLTDVLIRDFMRGPSVKGTLKEIKRGTIYVDAAELSGKPDGEVVGSIFGMKVRRKASLANGIIEYYDAAGNLLATNT